MKNCEDLAVWRFGANFIPSTAINQLEMWQRETFDPITIKRELAWAAAIGMRVMRVYLHDLLYSKPDDLFRCMDEYLSIADSFDIRTVFVFFDDCWNNEFALGKQPAPIKCKHNSGWIKSPGRKATADFAEYPRLERYVKGVMNRYKNDPRVLAWDLFNEPGNGDAGDHETKGQYQGKRSLNLLKAVFDWAGSVSADQGITVGVWSWEATMDELNAVAIERSEITSFHCYLPPAGHAERMTAMRYLANGRPLMCTEYMARRRQSTFEGCLPMMKNANCTAINWGLVAGKTNTIYPWRWTEEMGEPDPYFHDVFHADGTPLYSEEVEFLSNINK